MTLRAAGPARQALRACCPPTIRSLSDVQELSSEAQLSGPSRRNKKRAAGCPFLSCSGYTRRTEPRGHARRSVHDSRSTGEVYPGQCTGEVYPGRCRVHLCTLHCAVPSISRAIRAGFQPSRRTSLLVLLRSSSRPSLVALLSPVLVFSL